MSNPSQESSVAFSDLLGVLNSSSSDVEKSRSVETKLSTLSKATIREVVSMFGSSPAFSRQRQFLQDHLDDDEQQESSQQQAEQSRVPSTPPVQSVDLSELRQQKSWAQTNAEPDSDDDVDDKSPAEEEFKIKQAKAVQKTVKAAKEEKKKTSEQFPSLPGSAVPATVYTEPEEDEEPQIDTHLDSIPQEPAKIDIPWVRHVGVESLIPQSLMVNGVMMTISEEERAKIIALLSMHAAETSGMSRTELYADALFHSDVYSASEEIAIAQSGAVAIQVVMYVSKRKKKGSKSEMTTLGISQKHASELVRALSGKKNTCVGPGNLTQLMMKHAQTLATMRRPGPTTTLAQQGKAAVPSAPNHKK